ncbi:acyl-phosphate--glycerol-3-phosphate O-acyltransferase [Yersinia entomophaga]|nr:acyl-phosphate--glycerol-3-phosphate O-acyltransferase [Yersinia entomophaga]
MCLPDITSSRICVLSTDVAIKTTIIKRGGVMSAIALGMILFAYLCGSISSAILVCRIAKLPDPRENGSGNPGATNVLRIGGRTAAAAVLVFDVIKGMLPVWIAYLLHVSPLYLGITAIAACLGHIYPVFFNFRGGKGVATAFGAIAPIGWDLTGLMTGTWLLTVLLSGYSSLGAIVSALIAPFYVWWFKPQFTFPVAMLSCLILMRHHDNIQRLWRGQESKIWDKLKKKRQKTAAEEAEEQELED